MQISDISQCGSDLNFGPRRPWPKALPALAWQNQLLCGFDRVNDSACDQKVIDLGSLEKNEWVEILKYLHPQMGFAELSRLSLLLPKVIVAELFDEWCTALFGAFEYRWSDRTQQLCAVLAHTPLTFQNWFDDKSLAPREASPLLALPDLHAFESVLLGLVNAQLSRSEGARALELSVELLLMGRSAEELLPQANESSGFVRRLEQWRFPMSSENDELKRQEVRRWPWPSQIQGQWQRFGDQTGLEIKIRTTSPQDLTKKLERLMTIPQTWSSGKP